MNYAPNTEKWGVNEIVIHDADAKEPRMLMVVIGRTSTGEIKTRYLLPSEHGRKVWVNHLEYLHDPKRFGLACDWHNFGRKQIKAAQQQFERMRIWNYWHKPGAIAKVASQAWEAIVTHPAYLAQSGRAQLYLDRRGAWDLEFTRVVKEASLQL